jgi:hypothetical protein
MPEMGNWFSSWGWGPGMQAFKPAAGWGPGMQAFKPAAAPFYWSSWGQRMGG